jgi:hypothetical protein
MAILVLILVLWRLHTRPRFFGGLGPWAETNIFGAATLGLLPGTEQGGDEGQPSPSLTDSGAPSNQSDSARTNAPSALPAQPPGLPGLVSSNDRPPAAAISTNLLNTNGPVTMIAAPPSDLVETPPGVATAANVPEAAVIARRLGEVRAKGGDIQISLSWQNFNDLDLHCIDPAGVEIFFSNRRSMSTGGELDVDQNAHEPFNSQAVENIYWPMNEAPAGLYRISVVYYAEHCNIDSTPFLVRTVVQGRTNYFRSSIMHTGMRERKTICNLQYDPSNPNPALRGRFVR